MQQFGLVFNGAWYIDTWSQEDCVNREGGWNGIKDKSKGQQTRPGRTGWRVADMARSSYTGANNVPLQNSYHSHSLLGACNLLTLAAYIHLVHKVVSFPTSTPRVPHPTLLPIPLPIPHPTPSPHPTHLHPSPHPTIHSFLHSHHTY